MDLTGVGDIQHARDRRSLSPNTGLRLIVAGAIEDTRVEIEPV
jgi:hypothetical protein